MRAVKILTPLLLVGGLMAVGPPPAGAAVGVGASATALSITVTGPETVSFSCVGGTTRVNGSPTTPAQACSALESVTIQADDSPQTINGAHLDAAAFSAGPSMTLTTLGGADVVTDTLRPDTINLGSGVDRLTIKAQGAANTFVSAGNDQDTLVVEGTAAGDGVYLSATGTMSTVRTLTTAGDVTTPAQDVEIVQVFGRGGDDGISSVDVGTGATLNIIQMDGGDGFDGLLSGAVGARMTGGPGPNSFSGGAGPDTIFTSSVGDTIDAGSGANQVVDLTSLRAGGRTIASGGGADTYEVQHPARDAVVRVRPIGAGASVTSSLSRPGRQDIGASFAGADVEFEANPGLDSRHLVDIVLSAGSGQHELALDPAGNDLVDITVPAGSWTIDDGFIFYTVDPAGSFGTITITDEGPVSVHGPWTDPRDGFAHRVVRDLLFRFLSPADRTALATRLAGGTPRATIVGELMDTDEYRGLDVDRIFVQYLRRGPDAGGRAFWIDSLDGGNPLWRMRAQVFGSPEYFTKAGGTNAAFVRKAYADVLGRLPDAAGEAYWVGRLAAGDLRSVVAKQFLTVAETRNALVDDQFLRFLDRKATPAERSTWSPQMNQPGGEQALIAFLAASASYATRT